MQTVITGATGLVGANLAILLLEQGHKVRCTRRKSSRIEHLAAFPIEWVEADLGDTESLVRAFSGADVVFHCAAEVVTRPQVTDSMRQANVEGTNRVLEAVRRAGGPRLVYVSSVVTLGITQGAQHVDEEHAFNYDKVGIRDAYAETKREAEELVRAAAARGEVDVVVVNPTYMLGPYDIRPSSGQLIIDVVRGNVPGHSYGFNCFVDVRDVCRGMILAWQKGRRGERYILGGHNMTYREGMELIARVAGVKPPRLGIPRWAAQVVGWGGDIYEKLSGRLALLNSTRVAYAYTTGFRFSSEKARRELGYQPGPLEPAIVDALKWFREHGMLPAA